MNRLGDVLHRLRQNEYVLQVALFETFIRELHRATLRADPSLLRPDRKIDLGKLIARGRDVVVEEEIEREVQGLDRKSSTDKCRYFRETLGVDWFDGKIVPLLDVALRIRNEILHENPDRQIDEFEYGLMHLVTVMLPLATVAQVAVLYPNAFALPFGMSAEEVRKHMPKPHSRKEKADNTESE